MRKIVIEGGIPLRGEVTISGAKNAVLPLMVASLLADGSCIIDDTPLLSDVNTMCMVLESLGVGSTLQGNKLELNTANLCSTETPGELVRQMRASFLVMGPLLAKFGQVKMFLPGGCAIGARPIDLHLKGFEAMGAQISIGHNYIVTKAPRLYGNRIYLDFPSVGATENLMMAATLAEGNTIIENAAAEPEIVDLSNFLSAMGAKIKGAGTKVIRIQGTTSLKPIHHTVIPDRIEAGTFMVIAAAMGEEIIIKNIIPEHLKSITAKLQETGVFIEESYDDMRIRGREDILPLDIKTLPYPGFPTDMQAQFMSFLTTARGSSTISETVFENRFMHVNELRKMAADIQIDGHTAIVNGVSHLEANKVKATDLRAGAALIIAGLKAKGITEIYETQHIERGYDNICTKLQALGAKIRFIDI
ncbi:MAG: UDP-N-acetylglucosamine 1-carboxyvinyltransferase [Bacillota bacterium]